ncbi:MAG: hypothetical protein F6K41_42635 [Symploca sp. SIO3E6]|nr:hypothetical protein [Caldora sp. SIO3E6]
MKINLTTILKKLLIATVLALAIMMPQLLVINPAQAQPLCEEGVPNELFGGEDCIILSDNKEVVFLRIEPENCPRGCRVAVSSPEPTCNLEETYIQFQPLPFACEPQGEDLMVEHLPGAGPLVVSVSWQGF